MKNKMKKKDNKKSYEVTYSITFLGRVYVKANNEDEVRDILLDMGSSKLVKHTDAKIRYRQMLLRRARSERVYVRKSKGNWKWASTGGR